MILNTILFFIGLVNALPSYTCGFLITIWLTELNFTKSEIGLLILITAPFSFKMIWCPIIDAFKPPFMPKTARKGWLFTSLFFISLTFALLAFIDPNRDRYLLTTGLILMALFSGSLHAAGIAYELDFLDEKKYGMGSFSVLTGFRVGILVATSLTLIIATQFGWQSSFLFLGLISLAASLLVCFYQEPPKSRAILAAKQQSFVKHKNILSAFWHESIKAALYDLTSKNSLKELLALIILFKLGFQLFKVIQGPFLMEMGFTKNELASALKVCGFIATISGAYLGAKLVAKFDLFKTLVYATTFHAFAPFLYLGILWGGKSTALLYIITTFDSFSGAICMTAFICMLWKMCSKEFGSVQYSLLWSLYLFKADFFGFLGTQMATNLSWQNFFLATGVTAICAAGASFTIINKEEFDKIKT